MGKNKEELQKGGPKFKKSSSEINEMSNLIIILC